MLVFVFAALFVLSCVAQSCQTSDLVRSEQVLIVSFGLSCSSNVSCAYRGDGQCHVTRIGAPFFFAQTVLTSIVLPYLTSFDSNVTFYSPTLRTLSLPALRNIGGDLVLMSLSSLKSFDSTANVGGSVVVSDVPEGFRVGVGRVAGNFGVSSSPALTRFVFNGTSVGGDVIISSNNNINTYSLDNVVRIGGSVRVQKNSYSTAAQAPTVSFNSLQTIDGSLFVTDNSKLVFTLMPGLLNICGNRQQGNAIILEPTTTYMLCPNQILTGNCGLFPVVPTTPPRSGCPSRKH